MVVTAHTPGSQASDQLPSSNQSPLQQPTEPSGSTSIGAVTSTTLNSRGQMRHSATVRFIAAAVCALVSVLAAVVLTLNPGEQPLNLVAFLLCCTAALITLGEAATSWIFRRREHSVFDALPLVGCALCTAATSLATFLSATPNFSILFTIAPVLAAAAACVGNGFAILGANASRTDDDVLFPRALNADKEYKLGDALTINAGDVVPVDGRIESGSLGVDERAFTTVANFRIREEQEVVFAGSEVIAGNATITALSTRTDSCLAQLQQVVAPLVHESQDSLQVEDARASRWTAFAIVFLAATLAISWREYSQTLTQPLMAAGMILVIATVCQLSVYLFGQRRALVRSWLSRGFLLAHADSCKDLAKITSVECDASRYGPSSLLQTTALEILDDRLAAPALCDFIASLVGRAEDPFLLAAADYCRHYAEKLSLERVIDLREYAGRGICGTIHGVELSVGSEDFLVERGIMVQPTEGVSSESLTQPTLLVAIDDDVVARFHISDTQEHLVASEGHSELPGGIPMLASSGVARELGDDVLLVRGRESDLIGQTAKREVSLFSAKEGAIQRTTVVAFTSSLGELGALLAECRAHVRAVDRLRLLAGFGGLVTVVSAFSGVLTPLIPLAWLILSGITLRISERSA